MRKSFLAAAISAVAVALSLPVQAGKLIPVPQVPGSTHTWVSDINESNVIAGYYVTADGDVHGFFGTLDGQYTTFDHPNGRAFVFGISDDGYLAGNTNNQTDDCPILGCAFIRTPDGTIASVTKDGANVDGDGEEIIKKGKFLGEHWFDNGGTLNIVGFYGKGATYRTDLVLPFNTVRTRPRGLDKNGTVTGFFRDLDSLDHFYRGFILKGGVATAFDYPDPQDYNTELQYFNSKGIVAGYWFDQNTTFYRPFLLDMARARLKAIDTGTIFATARGINDAGLVTLNAGNNSDFSDGQPFIYCSKKATCPQMPGAIETRDRWIAVPPGSLHSVMCRNGCLAPPSRRASAKPATAEDIRRALESDPALRMEMRLSGRQ